MIILMIIIRENSKNMKENHEVRLDDYSYWNINAEDGNTYYNTDKVTKVVGYLTVSDRCLCGSRPPSFYLK